MGKRERGCGWAVLFCVALWAGGAGAEALPGPVRTALKEAGLPSSSLAVWVQDTQSRRPVLKANADESMNPASVMKLVTTYAALEMLGPSYTWKTEAYAGGEVDSGTLRGDLILKGYGDPHLTLEDFWLLLRQLRQDGLRDIRGGLVLDQSYFAPLPHDPASFDNEPYRAYNAGPQALLLNFSAVSVRIMPRPEKKTVWAVPDPSPRNLQLLNRLEPDPGPCGDWREGISPEVSTAGDTVVVTLRGRFPTRCGDKVMNLNVFPRNESYVGGVFRQLWTELYGNIGPSTKLGTVAPSATLLIRFESAPLADLIRDINKYSNNVMARQTFLTLGAVRSGPPATPAKGAEAIRAWLAEKGMAFPELVLENGSGLSRTERISAQHLGALLVAAYRSPVFSEFESSLPIVAVDGTMKKRLTGQQIAGHAHIKTGSLENVRAVAGYVFDRKGRRMAVVALVNHPRAANSKEALDALLRWVYARP